MKKTTNATKTKSFQSNTGLSISLSNYINSALKTFSQADNARSIPNIDGLKPAQRKAIYGALLRGENAGTLQVERLSAFIAERTDYHHGVGSMIGTIASMAADRYPGSNNMNLFIPEGQFGSRLTKEPGAGRYIESALSPYFRALFKKEDDIILEHHEVDGERIEPKLYLPILPLVLINGANGTGTGHACEIKSYHPTQIRDACLNVLAGKKLKRGTLLPWFRGYHGTVTRNPDTGQVLTSGVLEVVNTTTIKITELPVGIFLDQYKDTLCKLEESGFISDWDDSSTEDSFEFTVKVPRSTTALDEEELYQKFKLIGRDTENFTIWNADGVLQRFETAEDIIETYVEWRLGFYEVRRQKQIADLTELIRYQSEVMRFIKFYLSHTKVFKDTGKKELIELLLSNKFVDYDRLLGMAIWNLTRDKIAEIEDKLIELRSQMKALMDDTADDMYRRELKAFVYKE
jgi:DNA topoisomerase II